jgi:hypothetical protein
LGSNPKFLSWISSARNGDDGVANSNNSPAS